MNLVNTDDGNPTLDIVLEKILQPIRNYSDIVEIDIAKEKLKSLILDKQINKLRQVISTSKLNRNQSASVNYSIFEINIRHHIDKLNKERGQL